MKTEVKLNKYKVTHYPQSSTNGYVSITTIVAEKLVSKNGYHMFANYPSENGFERKLVAIYPMNGTIIEPIDK